MHVFIWSMHAFLWVVVVIWTKMEKVLERKSVLVAVIMPFLVHLIYRTDRSISNSFRCATGFALLPGSMPACCLLRQMHPQLLSCYLVCLESLECTQSKTYAIVLFEIPAYKSPSLWHKIVWNVYLTGADNEVIFTTSIFCHYLSELVLVNYLKLCVFS